MKGTGWLLIFILDAICDLLSIHFGWNEARYLTKPLITVLLALYASKSLRGKPMILRFLLPALGFSACGDTLLLFDASHPVFFQLGLASFLFAHFFYILLFLRVGRMSGATQKYYRLPVLAVFIYMTGLFLFLRPALGSLAIPVFIYACTLAIMLISSISALDFSKVPGKTCIAGALLFVLSDSLLAINKFHHPIPGAGLIIMLLYVLAQLFIVTGICRIIIPSIIVRS
jgi:uncharacterized membrane protein YhhN